jgi:hypothetical protein
MDAGRMRRLLLMHQIPLTNSSITVRRAAFEAVTGFDEAMPRHQDRELLLRLALAHVVVLGDSADVAKYRERRSISHEHRGYIGERRLFPLPHRARHREGRKHRSLAGRGARMARLAQRAASA